MLLRTLPPHYPRSGVLIQNRSAHRSHGLSDHEQHTWSPKKLCSHSSWWQHWPHTNQLQPTCSKNPCSENQVRAAWLGTLPPKYSPGLCQNIFRVSSLVLFSTRTSWNPKTPGSNLGTHRYNKILPEFNASFPSSLTFLVFFHDFTQNNLHIYTIFK